MSQTQAATAATQEFLFDVKLLASFRVRATSMEEAREALIKELDCATVNAGAIDGNPLVGEASLDGGVDFIEV